MPKLLSAEDMRKARKQATTTIEQALEQARTPLYAALGAGELATEAVRDYVVKARSEAGGQAKDVQTRINELQTRLAELQARLAEVRGQARTQLRTRVSELPEDMAELRGRLDAAELRQALERYLQSLQATYERLATRGEATATRLREQPQVKRAIDRVEGTIDRVEGVIDSAIGTASDTAEGRVGKLVEDARELTFEVLGRISRRTRSVGEKAAVRAERVADDLAETVGDAAETVGDAAGTVGGAIEEAGDEVASTTRSVSRKVANRAAAPRRTTGTTGTTGATRTRRSASAQKPAQRRTSPSS